MTEPWKPENLSWDEYRALEATNWSSLKNLRSSPLHYITARSRPHKTTPAMALGSATHTAILEPKKYAQEVAVWHGGVRRGKVYDAWCLDNEGKTQIRAVDEVDITGMADAVREHFTARKLLEQGLAEVTIKWTDPITGLPCKGRADWLNVVAGEHATLVDLKTTQSTDARKFGNLAARFGYHCQLAYYAHGIEQVTGLPVDVVIIAVESSPPYDVGVFELSDDDLYAGLEEVYELLGLLKECLDKDEWPGRCDFSQPLQLPRWVFEDDDPEDLGLIFGGES